MTKLINIYYIVISSFIFLILPAEMIYSETVSKENTIILIPEIDDISVYIQTGKMTGEANEYVMDGSRILSRLIWKIDSVNMAGGGIIWEPSDSLSITADLWLKTADGESTMDDYDWLDEDSDWTHWSHHDNTAVTKGSIFDLSAAFTPERFIKRQFKFRPVLGYKRTNFEWQARGGTYIYTKDTFRDTEGTFPDNQLGITYEQTFHTPYAGFDIEIPAGILLIGTRMTGSFAVFGKAVDHHHLRDLVTTAYFYWGDMFSLDMKAGFKLGQNIKFTGEYNYMYFGSLRGNSAYNQSGTITVYENIEKADLETFMLSFSLLYSF